MSDGSNNSANPSDGTRKLTNVYSWVNGMVIAFDQHGRQMPEYQGPKEEVWDKIMAEKERRPDEIEIKQGCIWR